MSTIKTKYDVGDKIWALNYDRNPIPVKVKTISIEVYGKSNGGYGVQINYFCILLDTDGNRTFKEHNLFDSKKDIATLILKEMGFECGIQEILDKE